MGDKKERKKKERKKGQNGDFCIGISQLHARMVRRTSKVASHYASEADLTELDLASRFARAPIPYVQLQGQAAILLPPHSRDNYSLVPRPRPLID